MGEGGGHLQSLLVGAVLLILSFLSVMLGIIADLIRTNRTLLEATLEHAKRSRYGPVRPALVGTMDWSAESDILSRT